MGTHSLWQKSSADPQRVTVNRTSERRESCILSISGGSGRTASYESWSPSYTDATLTWRLENILMEKGESDEIKGLKCCRANRVNGDIKSYTVNGIIRLPSDEPQGGSYQITSCGGNCQVLMRLDQTNIRDF